MAKRVSSLLDCFGPNDRGLSVRELSRRSNLPLSSVSRISSEMIELGLLDHTSNGRVCLGMRLFELGQMVPRQRSLRDAARAYLEDLREVVHHTVSLAVLEGNEVLYLAILGTKGQSVPSRLGVRMPANCTGIGKAILAYSSLELQENFIASGLLTRTPRSIGVAEDLRSEFVKIRKLGFSVDNEESRIGTSCVAVPIFRGDTVVAGISITGKPSSIVPEHLAPPLKAVALSISRSIRY